jgi:hypothetical protein
METDTQKTPMPAVRCDELLAEALEVLRWIETRGNQSGVIPCPRDYEYYIIPIRNKAEQMADKIEEHSANGKLMDGAA